MFTSCYKAVFTCLFCVTTAFSVFADSPRAAYEQARQEALCAWMAMASYGDRPGLAARQELVRRGWHIDSQVQKDDKSEAKFHLARKGDDTLLAVTGTASLADIKSDLNLHSVAYGGTAGKTARKDGVRRVHAGFDHYTTTLLAAPMAARP
ncbi:lipase class 3 [Megasphaera sp. NM10]|nr:lipase class 3 [Megasphaera sp. NM10]